jgi:hypothetical protein
MVDSAAASIAGAIAAGAAVALKDTASAAVKDAYAAIKALISNKYHRVDTEQIEKAPDSKGRQEVLSEELVAAGAERDRELRSLVVELVHRLEAESAEDPAPAGVKLRDLKVRLLEIDHVSEGAGVEADTATIDTIRVNQVGKKKD